MQRTGRSCGRWLATAAIVMGLASAPQALADPPSTLQQADARIATCLTAPAADRAGCADDAAADIDGAYRLAASAGSDEALTEGFWQRQAAAVSLALNARSSRQSPGAYLTALRRRAGVATTATATITPGAPAPAPRQHGRSAAPRAKTAHQVVATCSVTAGLTSGTHNGVATPKGVGTTICGLTIAQIRQFTRLWRYSGGWYVDDYQHNSCFDCALKTHQLWSASRTGQYQAEAESWLTPLPNQTISPSYIIDFSSVCQYNNGVITGC